MDIFPLTIFRGSPYWLVIYSLILKKQFKMDQTTLKQCQNTLRKNNYEPIRKLGMGGFGVVFLVSKIGSNSQFYSIKCTNKKQFIKKPAMRRYLKQQISLMQSLDHQNIVKLYQSFQDNGWIFMILEYCDIGNLTYFQMEKKQRLVPFMQCSQIIKQAIQGLNFMHDRGILHRDIKPQNILLKRYKNNDFITKICDLGFSREAEQNQASTFCGTTYYMAPQIFQKKNYGKSIDVWAIGVLMHNMLFGVLPFKSQNMELQISQKCQPKFNVNKKRIRPNSSIDEQLFDKLNTLFGKLFVINSNKRISLKDIDKFLTYQSNNYGQSKKQNQETLDSDNCSQQSKNSPRISFQMEQVKFINNVLDEVSSLQFLEPIQFMTLKYFLDRVCLSILSCQRKVESKQQKQTISRLWESQKFETNILLQNIKSCKIPKLAQIFTGKQTIIFREYKQQFRLAVGHAFYKAHKNIKDYERKMRIKLKIFCCHVINRVFEKQYNKQLFVHYFNWLKDIKNKKNPKFQMKYFKEWIEADQVKNIVETVEIINSKFYRRA